MKNLSLISFVGVDNKTELDRILSFTKSHIKYEFGVLYSDSKNGADQRYPSHDFSNNFLKWSYHNKINSSLHLCGKSIDRYLSEDVSIIDLCSYAGRIQLNLNIKKYNDYDMLSDNILRIANKYNNNIILQENNTKKIFNKILLSKNIENNFSISLLNDSSGGFGKEIKDISSPHEKYFTGYAGGVKLSNIIKLIYDIENVNYNNKQYYIDMESGIRDNNIFSLIECEKIKNSIDIEVCNYQ